MLKRGLRLVNVTDVERRRRSVETNVSYFKSYFGKHPLHLCRVWRDLQTTTIAAAVITPEEAAERKTFVSFMAALHFLKCYDFLKIRANLFKELNRNIIDNMTFHYIKKIAALKGLKITWPDHFDEIFIASVDGTHFHINEPREPDVRKNPKNYSFKFHLSGLNYEIVLHLWENRIINAKTGEKASVHDLTIFRQDTKAKVPPGKRIICDNGYYSFKYGEDKILACPSVLDSEDVKEFKKYARARHEQFNSRNKKFACLTTRFRHGTEKHQLCFDAVMVLTQYAIEDTGPNGEPLMAL
jgi:hypothetical protein